MSAQIFPVVGSNFNLPNPLPTEDLSDGVPGSPVPVTAIQVAGSDGTDLQTIATDSSGQVKILLENSVPAGTNVIGHVITDATSVTLATTNADTTIGGTAPPAKELLVAGKTNDGTPQYQPIPEGTGGRSVIIEGVAGGTAVPTKDAADMTGTTPGTAPSSTLIVGEIYNQAAPVPVTGQTLPLQSDANGNQFVRTSRRSLTVAQATTIASSTASTTVLAAQAAGIFADISDLIITVTPQSVTGVAGTATLSDGTNNYVFDIVDATITGTVSALVVNFTTPLAATTAATPWTIALSNGTMTVHITVNAVLQKAS